MHSHTITLALAAGIAALAPAAALAQPIDAVTPTQNLQSPDARDAAAGRGTDNSPRVVFVKVPQPSTAASTQGIDWTDAGIGAGGLLGLSLLGLGGTFVIVHRKRAHDASPVASL
jgi:hypothetical protein